MHVWSVGVGDILGWEEVGDVGLDVCLEEGAPGLGVLELG